MIGGWIRSLGNLQMHENCAGLRSTPNEIRMSFSGGVMCELGGMASG